MESDTSHQSTGFIYDEPGIWLGSGPYTRSFKFYAGDVIYQLRFLHHNPRSRERTEELLFLGYSVAGDERSFDHIPYEDDAFCWAAKACSARTLTDDAYTTTTFAVMVNGELQSINRALLREVDFMTMSDPVWCPVANMAEERRWGPGGQEARRGSKHFAPGARIYCFPARWGDGYDQIQVVGRHRATHRYVNMIISSAWLTNWRVQLVYSPTVARMLWPLWDGSARSQSLAQEYVDMMLARSGQPTPVADHSTDEQPDAASDEL